MLGLLLLATLLMHSSRADDDDNRALDAIIISRMEKQQLLGVCNRNRQQAGMSAIIWSLELEKQAMKLALTCPMPGSNNSQTQSSTIQIRRTGSYQNFPPGFEAIQKVGCAKADCSQALGPEYGAGIVLVCVYGNAVDDLVDNDHGIGSYKLAAGRPSQNIGNGLYQTGQGSPAGSYSVGSSAGGVNHPLGEYRSAGANPSSYDSAPTMNGIGGHGSTSSSSYVSSQPSTGSFGGHSSTSDSSYIPSQISSGHSTTSGSSYTSLPSMMNRQIGGYASTRGGQASSASYIQQPSSRSSSTGYGQSSIDNSSSRDVMESSSQHELLLDGIPVITN